MGDVIDRIASPTGLRIACSAAATALLLGCTKQVVVETTFPDPVIEELPLDAGIYYPASIRDYEYAEDLPNDVDWEFDLGDANVRMLKKALEALFGDLIVVDEPGGTGPPYDRLDLVIHPTVDAFEFSLPRQSRSDQYAVWIRYNLEVYEPQGQLITSWPVSAYGQADSKLLRGGGAMETAVVRALRDAIANIVIGFPQDPKIAAALLPGTVVPAEAATEELAAEPIPETGGGRDGGSAEDLTEADENSAGQTAPGEAPS